MLITVMFMHVIIVFIMLLSQIAYMHQVSWDLTWIELQVHLCWHHIALLITLVFTINALNV